MAAEVLIIGGGPAGMAAALTAKAAGASVLLLEQNEKLGKKLYITGKGRCNVCNLCTLEEFLAAVPRNPRFLHAALANLSPEALREWLHSLGCPTVVERGRRVFPASQKASDVTRAFQNQLSASEIRFGAKAMRVLEKDGQVCGVELEGGERLPARAVILATGGLSYPVTGATGLGHKMAERLGHTISPLSPSLTGFNTRVDWPRALQGLTLKNVALRAEWGKKGKFVEQGELLFTHYGVSGPLALSLSSYLAGQDVPSAQVSIDFKPALTTEVLRERLQRDIATQGKKTLPGLLGAYLPASLASAFAGILGLDEQKPLHQLTTQERERLLSGFKALPLPLASHRAFTEAVVTRGGVEVKQVSPSTMASRLVAGLYVAGELLDVDALTGGYNLQIAFSTGALAGKSAAHYVRTMNESHDGE